jgi:N-acetylmuramoyl-L-alanine amidase
MPSILVETGFITNPQEEAYLNSEEGQNEIANCVTAALKNYIKYLEKKQTSVDQVKGAPIPTLPQAYLEAMNNHGNGQEHANSGQSR